jgi:3-hydroxyacyl-[acyl-carrier-protein] dehydratase
MLHDDFYTIIDKEIAEVPNSGEDHSLRKYNFTIRLNADHPVYKGHFPGNPVVPGVCQVQIFKELASSILQTDLVIKKSDNIKFLAMIVPASSRILTVTLEIKEKEPGSRHITGVILNKEQVFLKFKGTMQIL